MAKSRNFKKSRKIRNKRTRKSRNRKYGGANMANKPITEKILQSLTEKPAIKIFAIGDASFRKFLKENQKSGYNELTVPGVNGTYSLVCDIGDLSVYRYTIEPPLKSGKTEFTENERFTKYANSIPSVFQYIQNQKYIQNENKNKNSKFILTIDSRPSVIDKIKDEKSYVLIRITDDFENGNMTYSNFRIPKKKTLINT